MVEHCQVVETEVLVIGGGGAGCRAAMAASDAGSRVTLVDKGTVGVTGATFDAFTWGKGIIAAVRGYNPTDNPEVHYREAMDAARSLASPPLVRAVAYDAPDRFRELLSWGLDAVPCQCGTCFGDSMVGAVFKQPDLGAAFRHQVESRDIELVEQTMVTSLLSDGRRCTGAVAVSQGGEILAFQAKAVIIATGGASTLFRYNAVAPELTGDGYTLALSLGAELANLEFYQAILGITEPIKIYFPQWYLAGKPPLYNAQGHRFLPDYLPADVDPGELMVVRSGHGPFSSSQMSGWIDIAIDAEIQAGRGTAPWDDEDRLAGVFCDFASLDEETRQQMDNREALPALVWLRERGVDLEGGPVSIAPFAHAFNGGIVIDENAQTRVPGLYACGEVAAGPHGANRLGGHMFAVLLVFGARAGTHAANEVAELPVPSLNRESLEKEIERIRALRLRGDGRKRQNTREAIQRVMGPVMIAKDESRLQTAIGGLAQIEESQLHPAPDLFEALSTLNLMEVAKIVLHAALLRAESRGPHFRTDYPQEGGEELAQSLLWRLDRGTVNHRWASL